MKTKHYLMMLLSGAALLAFASCEKKTPEEEAAEELGDSIEDAGDAIEDAGNEVGDAIKDATN